MALADPQSFNRYAYVNNDPINRVDPQGLQSKTCGGNNGTPCTQADDYKPPQQPPPSSAPPVAGFVAPTTSPGAAPAVAPAVAPAAESSAAGVVGRAAAGAFLAPWIAAAAVVALLPVETQAPTLSTQLFYDNPPPDDDRDAGGSATVNLYAPGLHTDDSYHFSVTVTYSGISLTTELRSDRNVVLRTGGSPAIITTDEKIKPSPSQTVTVPLPNARAALAYQGEALLQRSAGIFDPHRNNCLTHVNDVLRMGGLSAPLGTAEGARFLQGLGLKR